MRACTCVCKVRTAAILCARGWCEENSRYLVVCQFTAKQKQHAVLYAGAQKYYSALIHMLGALLIEVPLGHCIFWPF